MPGEFETLDCEANALDAALGQDTDASRTPHITALWAGLAAGGQLAETDLGVLIDDRQLVGPIDPPSVLSLSPVALYRASYLTSGPPGGSTVASWLDSTANGNNASVQVGTPMAYSASYAGFGGLPAVVGAAVGYLETTATFAADSLTLLVGFVATAVSNNDIIVSLSFATSAWIGRDGVTANTLVAGVLETVSPYGGVLPAIDGRPHVIALRRRINADGTATRTAWLDGVKISEATVVATTTSAQPIHIGGNVADGNPMTGALGCVAYWNTAITDSQVADASQFIWVNDLGQSGYLGQAAGSNLDQWGALIGQPRSGLTDAEYRLFISARPMANRSTGAIDELTAILATACGVTYTQTGLDEYFPAAYGIYAVVPTALSAQALSALGRLMEDARCMGIGAQTVVATGNAAATFYFGFLEDTRPERRGFGVGTFAVSV